MMNVHDGFTALMFTRLCYGVFEQVYDYNKLSMLGMDSDLTLSDACCDVFLLFNKAKGRVLLQVVCLALLYLYSTV